MYKTCMSHANVKKKFLWEGIQLCAIFVGTIFFVGGVEASWVGGWCSMRERGRPGSWIPLSPIWWIHDSTDF